MYESDSNSSKLVPPNREPDLSNKAVQREIEDLPETVRKQFFFSLQQVCQGWQPSLEQEKLHAAGKGVIELKVPANRGPAYRCMYVIRKNGNVVVLHATSKTTKGQDKQLVATTAERLKQLGADR